MRKAPARAGARVSHRTGQARCVARMDRQNAKFAVILAERGVPGV